VVEEEKCSVKYRPTQRGGGGVEGGAFTCRPTQQMCLVDVSLINDSMCLASLRAIVSLCDENAHVFVERTHSIKRNTFHEERTQSMKREHILNLLPLPAFSPLHFSPRPPRELLRRRFVAPCGEGRTWRCCERSSCCRCCCCCCCCCCC